MNPMVEAIREGTITVNADHQGDDGVTQADIIKNLGTFEPVRDFATLCRQNDFAKTLQRGRDNHETKLQDEIINAISYLNYDMFVDLGGMDRVDLNFMKIGKDGTGFECPLFCVAAKGDEKML